MATAVPASLERVRKHLRESKGSGAGGRKTSSALGVAGVRGSWPWRRVPIVGRMPSRKRRRASRAHTAGGVGRVFPEKYGDGYYVGVDILEEAVARGFTNHQIITRIMWITIIRTTAYFRDLSRTYGR